MIDLLDDGAWKNILSCFKKITTKYDSQCFRRKRVFNSAILVQMIVGLVQSKNKHGYDTVINDYWMKAQVLNPRFSTPKPVAKSSFSDARLKLNPEIFKELNHALIKDSTKAIHRWMGHRVYAVDGSKINLPRTLIDEGFALPNPQSYYPQGLISCLYDLKGKVVSDLILSSERNERACAYKHLNHLNAEDIVIYDRGYQSYGLLYRHIEKGIHPVMRMETATTFNAVKDFVKSPSLDKIVKLIPAEGSLGKIRKSLPEVEIKPLTVRLIKYKVKGNLYVIATTLLNKRKYQRKALQELYRSRWAIEEMFKSLKNELGISEFHGRCKIKVEQELFAGMFLMTLSRVFSNSTEVEANPRGEFQSNYKNAIHIVGRYFTELFLSKASIANKLIRQLVTHIGNIYQKIRPGRSFERVSKKPRNKWSQLKSVDSEKERQRSRKRNRKKAKKYRA